ncbi:TPA: hypothetical protein QB661_002047, partial [Pasteurella multocida]|nr:hypothetical protein [Pasteurella multocida]
LRVLVENKQQENAIFNSFLQEKMETIGVVRAISIDDLFKERSILSACFSYDAINKLKELESLNEEQLRDLQDKISDCIDELIEDLESE